jgi:hypothetical protein
MAISLIEMPGGSQENPVYLTVANLARLGPEQYAAVLSWVEQERAKRAAYVAKNQAEIREIVAEKVAKIKARDAAQREHDNRPATLADVRR